MFLLASHHYDELHDIHIVNPWAAISDRIKVVLCVSVLAITDFEAENMSMHSRLGCSSHQMHS